MKPATLIYAIIFSIFFINGSYAQTGLSIGASGSYLYSYRNLVNQNDADPVVKMIEKFRDEREEPISSFQFSLDALYQFKNNWNITSGIGFSNYGHQIEYSDFLFGDQIGPNGFSPSPGIADEIQTNHRLAVLSIPLMVGYRLPIGESKKHSLLFRLGISNHFLLKGTSKTTIEYENETSEKFSEDNSNEYKLYSLFTCANIGYYYQMNKHNIGLSLLGDYGLTPVNENTSALKQYQYFGGVGLSYFYSFN